MIDNHIYKQNFERFLTPPEEIFKDQEYDADEEQDTQEYIAELRREQMEDLL